MLNSPPGALASSSLLVLVTFALSAAAAPFSSWAGKRSSNSLADNGGEVAPLSAAEIRQLIYDLGRPDADDDDIPDLRYLFWVDHPKSLNHIMAELNAPLCNIVTSHTTRCRQAILDGMRSKSTLPTEQCLPHPAVSGGRR